MMIQYVKSTINTLKNGIFKRYTDLNTTNLKALGSLSSKVNSMIQSSDEIISTLSTTLSRSIENTTKLEKIITGILCSSRFTTSEERIS